MLNCGIRKFRDSWRTPAPGRVLDGCEYYIDKDEMTIGRPQGSAIQASFTSVSLNLYFELQPPTFFSVVLLNRINSSQTLHFSINFKIRRLHLSCPDCALPHPALADCFSGPRAPCTFLLLNFSKPWFTCRPSRLRDDTILHLAFSTLKIMALIFSAPVFHG